MSRFNFGGNRRNNGSSDQDRYEREVFFNRQQQGYPQDRYDQPQEPYQEEPEYVEPRLNVRGNEQRSDNFRQYPPSSSQPQSEQYFKGHPQVPTRAPVGTRPDFPQLRGYSKPRPNQDELKGLSFWREEEDTHQDDPENWNDRPSPIKFVIAISGLVALTGIAWFTYRWISQPANDTPPLVQAEPGPFKVRPENPGGIAIPHQDKLIYGRLTPSAEQPVERLLPPPDQPVVMPTQNQHQPGYGYAPNQQQPQQGYQTGPGQPGAYNQSYEQNQGSYPTQSYPQQGQQGYPPQEVAPGMQQQAPQEPGYAQQPGGQPVYNQGYQQAPTYQNQQPVAPGAHYPTQGQNYPSASNQPVQTHPGAGQPYPQGYGAPQPAPMNSYEGKPNTVPPQGPVSYPQNVPTTGVNQENTAATPKVIETSKPTPSEANKPEVSAIPGQAFYIQLGTLPTEQLAKQEADRLTRKFRKELVGFEPSVRTVEGADGSHVFRVIAGPFKTRNAALAKSNQLGSGGRVVQLQN